MSNKDLESMVKGLDEKNIQMPMLISRQQNDLGGKNFVPELDLKELTTYNTVESNALSNYVPPGSPTIE